jgi:hypothetical protein
MTGLLTQLSAAAAGSLVAAVWEGLVLTAAVALCLRLLPEISAAARSVVWLAVMGAVVLLPFVRFTDPGQVIAGRSLQLDERLSVALVCLWAAMSVWRAAQLVRSALYLRTIGREARTVEVFGEMASLLGNGVRLCVSEAVDRPSVVGFWRPRILVPATLLEAISQEELAQIVLHEMEHLRRRDDWTNLLQKLSLVLFPLNPVLVWIERRLCLERELACDDQVLRTTNARKAYAACLASLAEHSLVRRGVSLALGAWERRPELVERVHRILRRPDRELGRRQAAAVVATMLLGLAAATDGLAHTPRLVSFGPAAVTMAEKVAPRGFSGGAESAGFKVRGISSPSAVMVKAVVPAPGKVPARRIAARRPTVQRAMFNPDRLAANMGHPVAGEPPLVVMVTWRATGAGVVVQSSQVSYAAVPVRNGWLFVQL